MSFDDDIYKQFQIKHKMYIMNILKKNVFKLHKNFQSIRLYEIRQKLNCSQFNAFNLNLISILNFTQ